MFCDRDDFPPIADSQGDACNAHSSSNLIVKSANRALDIFELLAAEPNG